jgi:hypothetical protein
VYVSRTVHQLLRQIDQRGERGLVTPSRTAVIFQWDEFHEKLQ